MFCLKKYQKKNSELKEVFREMKELLFFLLIITGAVLVSMLIFGCGPELTGISVTSVDEPTEETVNQEPVEEPITPDSESSSQPVTLSSHGGGGGGSNLLPQCVLDLQCPAGFECNNFKCKAIPECRPASLLRPAILCPKAPNDYCTEELVCKPLPCEDDTDCTEPGYCLPDLDFIPNGGEGDPPTICREKFCPVVGETVDPETIFISDVDIETMSCEDLETEKAYLLNVLQNVIATPSFDLSEAWKACEIAEDKTVLRDRLDALLARKVLVDDRYAAVLVKFNNTCSVE